MLQLVNNDSRDVALCEQMEHTIRRVKAALRYRGSVRTGDFCSGLVAKWVKSQHWNELRDRPDRDLTKSVRKFIIDELRKRDRRNRKHEAYAAALDSATISDEVLLEMIDLATVSAWLDPQIARLENGEVDPRVRMPVFGRPAKEYQVREAGRALRLESEDCTQAHIAVQLGISAAGVERRLDQGRQYLALLYRASNPNERRP